MTKTDMDSVLPEGASEFTPGGSAPNIDRQPSRTSNRPRPNINYTNLATGTGEVSEPQGKEIPPKKLTGLKVNQEIFKKCVEFLKKLRESA